MSSERDLTKGSVGKALFWVSAPMTLGILGTLLVGLADSLFLARVSPEALAAIGFVYPVIVALTSLSIGLAAGTNTVVSQAIGKGEDQHARNRLTLHSMLFATVLSVGVSVLFFFAAPWIFASMGAKDKVLEAALSYIPYWCLSFPPMVVVMALNAVFRAAGNSTVAATTMLLQSLLNIALNPIFIFGAGPVPALGMAGAGLATLIARIAGLAGLVFFAWRTGFIRFDCGPAKNLPRSISKMARVGIPASLSNAINPVGMAVVTAAVATIGDAAVAGFGAAGRVQSFVLVPLLALSSGIGPVVGQNWGAGEEGRARKALWLCFVLSVLFGFALALLFLGFADFVANLMTKGGEPAKYAASYLRVVSWGFFGYGILVTANAAMNARDRAQWSMWLSAARIALLYAPLAWLGVFVAGYNGILVASVLANVVTIWWALVACHAVGLFKLDWAIVATPSRWIVDATERAS
ncbi:MULTISPECIES: MATE family efflux transporter [unclassified Roseovarius]|uniref:MATE family efflux transporter n=1 Tax=unclassified Roseovarius TaxID=2614913 RepID=UPI00273CF9E0|nr:MULTISPECIES: MATE family efflux transporter [unclassified Roseovarius]